MGKIGKIGETEEAGERKEDKGVNYYLLPITYATKILGTKRKLRSMLTVVFEGLSYGIKISSRSDRNFL